VSAGGWCTGERVEKSSMVVDNFLLCDHHQCFCNEIITTNDYLMK
jgi:hypothetical protein